MSNSQSDGGQKHFAVGRGLLAATETLNFNMNEQHSSRRIGGGGIEGQGGSTQMSRHSSGNNLGSTMKLFASLGLSPSDLDALAEIPEEDISVETLPHILMQLKNRKGDAGERRAPSSMSSDAVYRGGRDSWEEGPMGRMGSPSLGPVSARAHTSADFGFSSLQDVSPGRDYSLKYSSSGGRSRERPYSELSQQDSYGGLGMGPPSSDSVFLQRRIGSPSNGKVQDFLGVAPPMFPHVCSLCDFDVHSIMEWNQHISGLRHAENRRLLLNMYPEWDPGMVSGRGGGLMETPNLSAGLLGPSPMSSGQTGGLSSSWGAGGPGRLSGNQAGQNKSRSRVVVVKYDRKPLSNKTLFAFTEPFGRLREHLVLKQKAFLEMSSHEEALDVVNYYEHHPASLYGKPITFYLSKRLMIIEKDARPSDRMDRPTREVKGHGSKVVFFSNLPREDEKKRELLTIAGRFGIVEKHLFLTDQAFVQLGTVEDAEMLVKYYSMNPLIIKGRQIRLNICAKYKTLNVNRRQGGSGGDGDSRRGGRANSTSSGSGTRTTTSTSKISSSKSSTSSRTREEEEMEEKVQAESPAAEEEVSGVTQEGEDVGEEAADGEGEEPETAEPVWEELKPEEELPVTVDATGDGGRTEAPQGAKSEEQGETEAEASTDEPENKEESITAESTEAAEGELPEQVFDQDFLENMEDFVTLDELEEDEDEARGEEDAIDNTRRGGMRVINIVGFRRGHNFLSELLGLAKPFGKVVKHLVLDLRPEAFLQFETEEEARAMAKFYNSNVTASVCGRPVRVSHSMSYPTIQCGSSRVVYIGQIPNTKYSDKDILKLAEPYGKVRKYFLNRIKRECFLEMDRAEEAEKMAEEYKAKLPRFNGKRLTVYVSRKYKQLKHGHLCVSTSKRASSSPPPKPSQPAHEPPAKKPREEPLLETAEGEEKEEDKQEREEDVQTGGKDETKETAAEEVPEVSEQNSDEDTSRLIGDVPQSDLQEDKLQEEPVGEMETSSNQNGEAAATPPAENKLSTASLPLPPFNPETPIGVEHVKMGYYCRVCFLFYSNEDTAKKTHCSSQTHYDKLQKYLEKEQSKAEKKKVKKTTA